MLLVGVRSGVIAGSCTYGKVIVARINEHLVILEFSRFKQEWMNALLCLNCSSKISEGLILGRILIVRDTSIISYVLTKIFSIHVLHRSEECEINSKQMEKLFKFQLGET